MDPDPALEGMKGALKVVAGLIGGAFAIALLVGMYYGVVFLVRYKDVCGSYSPLWLYTLNVDVFFLVGLNTCKAVTAMITNATKSKALIAYEKARNEAARK